MKIGPPTYTKDGVTVARNMWSADPVENAAIQTAIGASMEMNNLVGDGTTTTVILTAALAESLLNLRGKDYQETLQYLKDYLNPASQAVKDMATPVETLERLKEVALVACNGDQDVADTVSNAVFEVGTDGAVTFQDSPNGEHGYEPLRGIVMDRGYVSTQFLGTEDKNDRIVLGGDAAKAVFMFICADSIEEADDIAPVLQAAYSHAVEGGNSLDQKPVVFSTSTCPNGSTVPVS